MPISHLHGVPDREACDSSASLRRGIVQGRLSDRCRRDRRAIDGLEELAERSTERALDQGHQRLEVDRSSATLERAQRGVRLVREHAVEVAQDLADFIARPFIASSSEPRLSPSAASIAPSLRPRRRREVKRAALAPILPVAHDPRHLWGVWRSTLRGQARSLAVSARGQRAAWRRNRSALTHAGACDPRRVSSSGDAGVPSKVEAHYLERAGSWGDCGFYASGTPPAPARYRSTVKNARPSSFRSTCIR